MCGLTGYLDPAGFEPSEASKLVGLMKTQLLHRGPDDAGAWVDGEAGIALGHQRLSVLDVSQAGHQPMASLSGRYVIVFNGEIYNHLEIRRTLQGSSGRWRGTSDTETLLAGFEKWGIVETLEKCDGMFAFALWDRNDRTLTVARDRMGEKPLYYGWQRGTFLFGSELKALRVHPAFEGDIERNSIALYLRYGYVPTPHSIYRGIFKLLPGSYLQVRADDSADIWRKNQSYWSLREVRERGAANPFVGSDSEAVDELEQLLRQSVLRRTLADVPLGAFLSGGIDSSAVVALMQDQTANRVKTFTIGFHEAAFDESDHARVVAGYLGTDHTELRVSPQEAMHVIPELSGYYDEPFGDSSAIPTLLVSKLARKHVTVALSGDGGDELFAGYPRYRKAYGIWKRTRRVPYPVRKLLARGLQLFPRHRHSTSLAWRANRLACYFAARDAAELYDVQLSQRQYEYELVVGMTSTAMALRDYSLAAFHQEFYDTAMHMDSLSYLPDDILVKVDRAAMAVSLETRVPMLDHRIVEFAARLPLRLKLREHENKWVLKEMLFRYVPNKIIERPKMGFGVPVGRWIHGPLREWAEPLVAEHRVKQEGFLDPGLIRDHWNRFLKGDSAGGDNLWTILMFQAWLASERLPETRH